MADAGPVFVVAGVVLAAAMAWAIWANVRPAPPWKVSDPARNPPHPTDESSNDVST